MQRLNAVVDCKDLLIEFSVEGLKFAQVFAFIAGILAGKGARARLVSFMVSLSCSLSTLYQETTDRSEEARRYGQECGDVQLSFRLLCNCVSECSDGQQLNEVQTEMCAAIGENISWKELQLGGSYLRESSAVYKVLCEVLKWNTTVEKIHLFSNLINDCSSMTEALKRNKTARELDLPDNQIIECSSLAEALKRNRTVKELDLSDNQIIECRSMAEALKGNNTVKKLLDLPGNRISDETALQDLERHNKHLKLLY